MVPEFSPRAVIFGALAFVVITLLMLAAVEWIGVERIQKSIENAGPFAPLVYILLKAATYIFAPLSAGPIQLSSGLLFGLWPGVFYSLAGEVIGGSISFLIARKLGRPAVARFVGQNSVARIDQLIGQLGGWRALAYARLFLFSIYDFISYAAGLTTTITFRQYIHICRHRHESGRKSRSDYPSLYWGCHRFDCAIRDPMASAQGSLAECEKPSSRRSEPQNHMRFGHFI
jgi:uncharacterized membrane protein YdjX (TVP38/TMEM64 family)